MKKLFIFLSVIFSALVGFSFATPSILNPSYSVDGDDVRIYRTDTSNGGYMDINLQDPETSERLHFGSVKFDKESFTYTKQWDGEQKIWIIPGDGGDEVKFTIPATSLSSKKLAKETVNKNESKPTRTVIATVPKTGPSGNIVGIILASLAIFGGYIYIKKRINI